MIKLIVFDLVKVIYGLTQINFYMKIVFVLCQN